jgi:hypothetical protein
MYLTPPSPLPPAGKSDHIAIQRWRSMTVEGIFKLNNGVESIFNAQLTCSIAKLENTLKAVFPDHVGNLIGHDEHLLLVDIVKRARDLSFKIQHGIVSCRLIVTTAGPQRVSRNVYGTFAFGLDRITGTDRTVLLEAKPITEELLQSS